MITAEEYLSGKTGGASGVQTQPARTGTPIISADDYLNKIKSGTLVKVSGSSGQKEDTSKVGDSFRWIGKQLMKPQGVAMKELRAVSEWGALAAQGKGDKAKEQFVKHQKGALDVFTGKEETSFSKELEASRIANGQEATGLDKALGLAGDIVVDPLWVIKPAKLISQISRATKLDIPAVKLVEAMKSTETGKFVRTLLTTKTGNKDFDKVVNTFRNLAQYREGKLLKDAQGLGKEIRKMGPGAEGLITEALENPKVRQELTDPKIKKTVEYLQRSYEGFLDEIKSLGLKMGEIEDYAPHVRTVESFLDKTKKAFSTGAREWGTAGIGRKRKLQGTIKELGEQGVDIFEKNPAVQLARKGVGYTKAITSKEFADEVAKFAVKDGFEVTNPLLKGLKFAPEQASVIDNFYQGIKPDELRVILRGFDKVQNIWKTQALVSPSYHIRNVAGNLWNNYLAGVNPLFYGKAAKFQTKHLTKGDEKLLDIAKSLGVIDEGWYASDIAQEITSKVAGVGGKGKFNPLSQNFGIYKANRATGKTIENNARLAHWLSKISEGMTHEKAAESVKKFLFDYGDLTKTEKTVMKRIMPFYTWTRKNLPIQIEALYKQPAKMVLPQKLINFIESGVEKPDERYMGHYIKENIPVRMRTNKDGNTEYFMLGMWLPYANAIDILSVPIEKLVNLVSPGSIEKGAGGIVPEAAVQMLTPALKILYEQTSGKSTFFRDTLGRPNEIKGYGEFIGGSWKNRNIALLRNIRMLNDANRWVNKRDPNMPKDAWPVKLLNTLFGKTATYDEDKAKYYYNRDTQDRIDEYQRDIKTNMRKLYKDKAEQLIEEMKDFIDVRTFKKKEGEDKESLLDKIKIKGAEGAMATPAERLRLGDKDYKSIIEQMSELPEDEFNNQIKEIRKFGAEMKIEKERKIEMKKRADLSPPSKSDERNKIIATVIGEALGEGEEGMKAVLNVMQNRAIEKGESLYEVVSKPAQFSAFNINNRLYSKVRDYLRGKDINLTSTEKKAVEAVKNFLNEGVEDLTFGASHYIRPEHATDLSWYGEGELTVKIGNHEFYKGVRY